MNRAFTLIELLLVISLMTIIGSLSALAGSDTYQRALAAGDVERIVGALYRARAMSQGNVCRIPPCAEPKSQGVHIEQELVSLFEGSEYEEDRVTESYPLSARVVVTPTNISFLPRKGAPIADSIVTIRDAFGRERLITVTEAGVISFD